MARGYQTDAKTTKRMSAIKPNRTKPEKIVRSLLTALGYRYRLHRHDLPGRPDIAFIGRRKLIFVHGCYWHRHEGCSRTTMPARNVELWQEKFDRTVERDRANFEKLRADGWDVLVVWECEISARDELSQRLEAFLKNPPSTVGH